MNIKTILILILILVSCDYAQTISTNDNRIKFREGKLYFQEELFSGKNISKYENGNPRSETEYRKGEKQGIEKSWYPNGNLVFERNYTKGKKEGIHLGWHEDGKIRFYFQFKNDKFDKENFTWYPNGNIESYMKYENGNLLGHKVWRIDGKIYMNYLMNKEEKIGLSGTKLCRKVEGNSEKTLAY